jgi:predicted glycogen debranching enzyme
MGTAVGARTRRYHGLLVHAATPPGERWMLVNGAEAWIENGSRRIPLTAQRFTPGLDAGLDPARITSFTHEPWPRWTLEPGDGLRVTHECHARHGVPLVVLRWHVQGAPAGARLLVRPLLSGRDPHALHHANGGFRFETERLGAVLRWRPYVGVPGVIALADGDYEHAPDWYWRFLYDEERARGLDHVEDLASPGVFRWDATRSEAVLVLAADTPATRQCLTGKSPADLAARLTASECRRRAAFVEPLGRAADAYLVKRGEGLTVIAGYPWFGDWGRDTFISLRGLCLATKRLDDARRILVEWAGAVSQGMLPNRFPDTGDTPEYNSVDASLWYVVVVGEWLGAMADAGRRVAASDRAALSAAVRAILEGYERGTRHGIRVDADGLLASGEPGVQLTWMDAKVDDWVVTPRTGKPVEIQALWVNALEAGARLVARMDAAAAARWREARDRARASFGARYWNDSRACLFDVVDVDHVAGAVDGSLRPNQLFAAGGLPLALVEGERARAVVDAVERELLTPLGPRSLAPGEPGYAPRYAGGVRERDGAYHQGTVWPWLMGAFVDAWLGVRGYSEEARREAARRFLPPLRAHLETAGLGHVSEIADADAPQVPNGCPFQAWSVGELLRLERRLGTRAGSRMNEPSFAR